ncbi:hypothetical protein AVEN_83515-1 [Araneus ventricosus]|uniref:Uncharacterized protein n=1 Tax=Araneus ventricosus TaxID=182803 RepID=A0A4Y2TRQ5_ARAVE|nr:hypothetical protein AVEN_83515-1 [Araneus ventricosus]
MTKLATLATKGISRTLKLPPISTGFYELSEITSLHNEVTPAEKDKGKLVSKNSESKTGTKDDIDRFVSAELPNPCTDLRLFQIRQNAWYMAHVEL